MNASPAAVPSTASTGGRRGARDLLPALEQDRPLGAERERGQAVEPPDRLELVAVDDEQVDLVEQPSGSARRGSGVQAEEPRLPRRPPTTVSTGISSWQSTASASPSRRPPRRSAFAPGATTIWFSPSSPTRISATPVGVVDPADAVEVDAALLGAAPAPRPRTDRRPTAPIIAHVARRAAPPRAPGSRPFRPGRARRSRRSASPPAAAAARSARRGRG